jgi:ESS family glutamate:Na+ symporter
MEIASFCGLCGLLLLGKLSRIYFSFLHFLYLPSCVIGGIYGLLIIQIAQATNPAFYEYLERDFVGNWPALPGFLINLVFASLFLGNEIPPAKKIWEESGNQLMYGLVVSLGQMLVGFLVTGLLLIPVFNVNPLFGQTLPIGFEGGHGTAAALSETLTDYGYPEGGDVSLGTATIGLLFSVTVGIALVNVAAKRGWVEHSAMQTATSRLAMQGILEPDERPIAGMQTVSGDSIDTFAWHLVVVGSACSIGYTIKEALMAISREDFRSFPLFPLCMMGGMIIQGLLQRYNTENKLVDRAMMERVAGTALDFLIVAAVSTVNVSAIADSIVPFLIICAVGLAWNVFAVLFIGKIMNPTHWFENSICVFGQSTGVIAAGLMLLRMVDPEAKTPVPAAFGYKQLIHATFLVRVCLCDTFTAHIKLAMLSRRVGGLSQRSGSRCRIRLGCGQLLPLLPL